MAAVLARHGIWTALAFLSWVLKQQSRQGCHSGELRDPRGGQTLQHGGSPPARIFGKPVGLLFQGTSDWALMWDPKTLWFPEERSHG